jgi:hypothetical protein
MPLGAIFVRQERRLASVDMTPEQNTIVPGNNSAILSISNFKHVAGGDPSELELTCYDIHLSTI